MYSVFAPPLTCSVQRLWLQLTSHVTQMRRRFQTGLSVSLRILTAPSNEHAPLAGTKQSDMSHCGAIFTIHVSFTDAYDLMLIVQDKERSLHPTHCEVQPVLNVLP